MRRVPADTAIAIVLLATCGFLLNDLLNTEGSGAFVKTTTLPTALVVVLMLLSVLLLGGSLLRAAGSAQAESSPGPSNHMGLVRVGAMIAWVAILIAALPWFGFLISAAVFLAGANLLYGNRNPYSIIAIAVIVPILLLLFFEEYMIVLLPSSRLFG
jgi:hypothetical protein